MSLERREGSVDGSLSNGELNESEMESSDVGSENGDDIESIDLSKITDPAQREHYEQLKIQEKEERAEIEKELKAHKEALARRGEELHAHEIREQERRMLLHEQALRTASSSSERHAEDLSIKSSRNSETPLSHNSVMKHERSSLDMLNNAAYLEQFARSPPRNDLLQDNPAHHWTFEEQFKQLYELSEEPKRREFLDDLFSFMQKRGTPVNRIPIMAKQTLDLYELFRLVVSKGGLVEVINKKLWREITKGLNLPSSITSAAFTLRTQYMKYLYPYECEKLKLSSPAELQAAIDGNRREGRRPSYGYDLSPGPTLIPHTPLHLTNGDLGPNHMNGRPTATSPYHQETMGMNGLSATSMMVSMNSWWVSQFLAEKSKEQKKVSQPAFPCGNIHSCPPKGPDSQLEEVFKGEEDSPLSTPNVNRHHTFTERDALAMEAASRAMEEATRKMEAASRAAARENSRERERVDEGPERKRLAISEEDRLLVHAGMPSAHLKITSRNDGRTDFDNSLVVSMEINGIMYQGVLFAQQARRM